MKRREVLAMASTLALAPMLAQAEPEEEWCSAERIPAPEGVEVPRARFYRGSPSNCDVMQRENGETFRVYFATISGVGLKQRGKKMPEEIIWPTKLEAIKATSSVLNQILNKACKGMSKPCVLLRMGITAVELSRSTGAQDEFGFPVYEPGGGGFIAVSRIGVFDAATGTVPDLWACE